MFGVNRKVLGLLIALVALGGMAFSAAPALAECTGTTILCNEANEPLRDDGTEPPEEGRYGADLTAVNTAGNLRLRAVGFPISNSTPTGYAFFGVELERNPLSEQVGGDCPAGHRYAQGHVTFADIQHSSPSPVYAGISPGGFGAWPFSVRSDKCEEGGGNVKVEQVHLYFPVLGVTAIGTFTGHYLQPGEPCAGGGIELNESQPAVSVGGVTTAEVDNGTEGQPAVICFVSSNNELFPNVAPEWNELQGSIMKD